MSESTTVPTLNCTQCSGELHPDEGQIFLTCPFCNSTVFLDKSKVVFHWYLSPTLDASKAQSALARWMAGNQTVKDLDKKAHIEGHTFEYFPLWYFKHTTPDGKEEIIIQPAAATSVSELRNLNLPAGDLKKYNPSLDSEAYPPNVPLDAALGWLSDEKDVSKTEIAESAIVHVPLFTFKYNFKGRIYTSVVEAATGRVLANIFPEKAEAPYQMVAGIAAVPFLCLATFPVIGSLGGGEGAFTGLAFCTVLGIPAAAILIAVAAWVAAKV
ncbi:MAG: hypothetical protein FVQ83_01810 [Chloroflexi bacterium]|nr:hypothetical protein [Chloroflexota bacterium]